MPGNNLETIGYQEALSRIKVERSRLIKRSGQLVDSVGKNFWLSLYTLAICVQERLISLLNDGIIASRIPWDMESNLPLVSCTIGDAISYAERLKDPEDHFLKALLLSFSGWTLLSTEQKECACNKGKLQEIPVDVLVSTTITKIEIDSRNGLGIAFFVGVSSDDQDHLEHHYSFKKQSVRHDNLIIIHHSRGMIHHDGDPYWYPYGNFNQAEQFRANKMAEILDELISSFSQAA